MRGEEKLEEYYADDARRLHGMVDRILSKFGGIYQKDRDDFYSLANEVLAGVIQTYDGSSGFDGYVYSCLSNRIKTEITRLNREKRRADRLAVSLDMPLGDGAERTVGDVLVADFDMEKELALAWKERHEAPRDRAAAHEADLDMRVLRYLEGLSKIQRQIVELKMEGVSALEIRKRLGLTAGQYERHFRQMKSFGNARLLRGGDESRRGSLGKDGDKRAGGRTAGRSSEETVRKAAGQLSHKDVEKKQISEKVRQAYEEILSLIQKMDSGEYRFDHPAQREADQWSPKMKGNLISDILQDNPIPALVFGEQEVGEKRIIWNLDGKQKCTTIYEFYSDGFRISRNVRRYLIAYQSVRRGRSVKGRLKEKKSPEYEWKECDIRGKKYSELPVELQERFQNYGFAVTLYRNCDSEDISYHMERYNEGIPLTQAQKGMVYLGDRFASRVKHIAGLTFFKDQGFYTKNEYDNGAIYRVVMESLMCSYFLENWTKQQEEMSCFLRENANDGHFQQFESLAERLTRVMNEDVAEMFDSKDSFLWFGLFARYVKLGLEDEKFVEFMDALWIGLHEKELDGVSFDSWKRRTGKDQDVVWGKMKHLEKLMMGFLGEEF